MERRLKEIEIQDNALIIQMISTRDRNTGKYLPMQDGNVNSMLHRIYNNIDNINRVYMTLPTNVWIDDEHLRQLEEINMRFLKSSIVFIYDLDREMYAENVAGSREKMTNHAIHENAIKAINSYGKKISQIICEFPVELHNTKVETIYNFNWNKISDHDNSPSAKSFEKELNISKRFDVFLFSDIQYDYMTSKTGSERIFRSSNIFNETFMKNISDFYIEHLYDDLTANIIDAIIDGCAHSSGITFFPSRVDDLRYRFEEVLDRHMDADNRILLVSNYMNVDLSTITTEDRIERIVDYSKIIKPQHSRFAYFYTLSKLTNNDVIPRYEEDMHISLIEQSMITNAFIECRHEFDIEQYIKN